MSPQNNRRVNSLYLLMALNILLVALLALAIYRVERLSTRLDKAEHRSYAGCVRGNVLREGYRFAMKKLDSPERAAQPEVAEQPCAEIYPGGAP